MKRVGFIAALMLGFAAPSFAAYTIARTDGGNISQVVQGREYELIVTNTNSPVRLEDVTIDLSNPNYDILVPPGVQTGSNKYSVDAAGQLIFTIRFHIPGTFSMTVKNAQDPNNKGTLNGIQVQKYPVTFNITPNNPTVNAKVPFMINVTALDADGVAVTAFEDAVQIVDSQLGESTLVSGSSFVNGQAQNVAVTVRAGDLNNQFTLTMTMVGTQYYNPALPSPHLAPRATKTTLPLNLIPGAYHKVVMLFPGQSLVPGTGKIGTVAAQQSGVPVSEVKVFWVDEDFNPILLNPAPPINVQFTSSDALADSPQFPFSQSMSGPILTITSAMNLIYFGGSGDRVVKAIPNGETSREDSAVVPVNPGSAESYVITMVGVAPNSTITTDDIVTVEIQAKDQNGNDLTTLFGAVSGAQLKVQYGGLAESDKWIDTNPATPIADNVVVFNAGKATMQLIVTKFGSDARIRYITPSASPAASIPFNVDVGAPALVHFTIVGKSPNPTGGQMWLPGEYPGNTTNSLSNLGVQAGDELVVEARITDKRWNLISGGGSAYNLQLTNNLPHHFMDVSHPSLPGPIYNFPNNGEFRYDANPSFDKAFRVRVRTAGPNFLVPAPVVKGVSNLAGSSQGQYTSSTFTVSPGAYSKLVIAPPGETLRPGIPTEADGKEGVPSAQQAGVLFRVPVFATDQYFNPIENGPFPSVNFTISPTLGGSFFSQSLPYPMLNGSARFDLTLQSGSNITVYQNTTPSLNQTVAIPVAHGNIDHFRMTFANAFDKEAGVPFQVTMQAEDKFNNIVLNFDRTIALKANTDKPGLPTMSPTSVALVGGAFTGNLTMFAATTTAKITMSYVSSTVTVSSDSPLFVVKPNPVGYQRLLLLLDGETIAPGTAMGKTGTPGWKTVGTPITLRAIACDAHFNPVDATGTLDIHSNRYASIFGDPAQRHLNPVQGHGEYSTTLFLRTAATHTITASDLNNAAILTSTSVIEGRVNANTASAFARVQILAPGEVADPGTSNPDGKTAAKPIAQKAGVEFTVTMNAVDQFWNVLPVNDGDTVLSSTSTVLFIPNNNTLGGPNPQRFTNGVATRRVILGQPGIFKVHTMDQDHPTVPGQDTEITVNPGPVYVISLNSPTAIAGQPFPTVTVTLEENGVPLSGYSGTIYVKPELASGGQASGNFSQPSYTMTNGVATISGASGLVYAHVERIKIRVSDDFGRVGYSNDVDVIPSGLKYQVIVPTGAVAGPPPTFNFTVRLLEKGQDTLVKNHDHEIAIRVLSALNPTTDGTYTVVSANLSQGVAVITQAYTKAESIIIQVSESATAGDPDFVVPSVNSNNIDVKADGYKNLLLVLPGETHVPGVVSATGKTGTAFAQQVGVTFLVQVRGVDQYWNTANDFFGGQIFFTSNDVPVSLNATNPNPQNAPLVNGKLAANMTLFTPGSVSVTVRDDSNSAIGVQAANVTVGGNVYEISATPQGPTFIAGPPSKFSMIITLKDSITGNVVTNANHTIDMIPLLADGTTAHGNLSVTSANINNGTVGFDQTYSVAEEIMIEVVERSENPTKHRGRSALIKFVPRQVRYTFEVPAEADVNVPFPIVIRALDQDTGTEIRNLNRTNDLEVFSATNGLPVTGGFVPMGAGVVNIVNGVATISAVYNHTESIFFKMRDNTPLTQISAPTQSVFTSQGSVNVRPGALATINLDDFTMQSNETRLFNLVARDTFGNPIPFQTLKFEVTSIELPGRMLLNGDINVLTTKVNQLGELTLRVEPSDEANGEVELIIRDADRTNGFSKKVLINVLGFPTMPSRALELGENRIPVNSTVMLDVAQTAPAGGSIRTYYRIDNGPWIAYDPSTGIMADDARRGYPVFDQTRTYSIEYYSEICYDVACASPVSQLEINGAPNVRSVETYIVNDSISGYPNPFNPKGAIGENYLTIQYPLQTISNVEIDIYDLFGQKVWHKDINAGDQGGEARQDNRVFWFGTNDDGVTVGNGGYIVLVKPGATGQTMRTKILVVK